MSAQKEIKITSSISKIGILAGGGDMPHLLARTCSENDIDVFVLAFEGQNTDKLGWITDYRHDYFGLGQVGSILKRLKAENIKDICLIGSIDRPELTSLKPDIEGMKLMASLATKNLGDDGLLKFIKTFFESKDINVHGMHQLCPNLLAPKGVFSKTKPSKQDQKDITYGSEIAQKIGELDVGQSVVVQNGLILGVEAIEGTDTLITRCKDYKRTEQGGVLVKCLKPSQDPDLDMPTIGLKTLQAAHNAKLNGIAVSAEKTLIADLEAMKSYANDHKMFLIGI